MIRPASVRLATVGSLLVLALSTRAVANPPPGASLLSNGNLASDRKGAGWPDGWPHPEGSAWEQEGDIHFLRLHASRPGQTVLLYRQVILPSPPPLALEIRLRVRYADIKRGEKAWFDGRVMGHFKDWGGKVVKPDPSAPSFTGSSKRSLWSASASSRFSRDVRSSGVSGDSMVNLPTSPKAAMLTGVGFLGRSSMNRRPLY